MTQKMSLKARKEMKARIAESYLSAEWGKKNVILDQFITATGYSRKHAITVLNHPAVETVSMPITRTRRYDERVQQALNQIWKVANRICAKRLVPFLPDLIGSMEAHGHLSLPGDVRERLLTISPATADRLLRPERKRQKAGLATTRPGSLIKRQIQVRTFADWDDLQAGFVEADLVAHCGQSMEGSFLYTLVLVDVATSWTECIALLRRSEADVIGALNAARQRLPFPLLGLDTDNGSEFINYELLAYCKREQITFTRARAYHRNDQAHVEEKNGSVVRRLIGYDRYQGVEAWRALNHVYEVLRQYQNFFQPSMKLLDKQRQGGRLCKRYDRAQTPCQRVLNSRHVSGGQKAALTGLFRRLDPVALLKELEQRQDRFWKFAYVGSSERTSPENLSSPGSSCEAGNNGSRSRTFPEPEAQAQVPGPRRYRRTRKPRVPRTWRTRPDAFAEVWPELRLLLEIDPGRTAKGLLQHLQHRYPGDFCDHQLRTLQRRVREWRREQLYQQQMFEPTEPVQITVAEPRADNQAPR